MGKYFLIREVEIEIPFIPEEDRKIPDAETIREAYRELIDRTVRYVSGMGSDEPFPLRIEIEFVTIGYDMKMVAKVYDHIHAEQAHG